jgi:pentatricopeptide repeat protein
MLRAGLKPDYISYVAVLSTCSHSGLVQEGKSYFDMMKRVAERGILSPITPRSSGIKASLYAYVVMLNGYPDCTPTCKKQMSSQYVAVSSTLKKSFTFFPLRLVPFLADTWGCPYT